MKIKYFYIKLLIAIAIFTTSSDVFATHNRAGEIYYEYIGPLSYRATIVTYTKISGISAAADRPELELDWGDGSSEIIQRSNGPVVGGVPDGELINNDIKMNIYISNVHTYQGPQPFYVISMADPNRIEDIVNIAGGAGSVNIPFYVEDTIRYFPPEIFTGNSSPILLNPPIDFANINEVFYHNPNAFDPDGDSLFFSLRASLQALGENVPGFQFPDQFPPGPNNNFTINSQTGEITWDVPLQVGIYNVAILIREYRNGILIGTMLRDMEIFVADTDNDPPILQPLIDTCIVAGESISTNLTATDPNPGDIVTITANGAPFQIDPSRVTFNNTPGNPATAFFEWQTICNDIRNQFYQVVFKAEDNFVSIGGASIPLVDLESWLIRVIPPPPDSLFGEIVGNSIVLNWDEPYICEDADKFLSFSVWRKIGCENINRLPCETGLVGTGYELIATNITDYTFTDTDVDRGNVYSYRIVANFGVQPPSPAAPIFDLAESVPSNEVCLELPLDLPVITNVSVDSTDEVNGVIFVQWSKPRAGESLLDTLLDEPPYIFELYRSEGFFGDNFNLIETFTAPSYTLMNDTLFYDSLLNTVDNPYSYKVIFKSENGAITLGETSTASSIYLEIGAGDGSLSLTWQEFVPWINETYTIFRADEFSGIYDSIDIVDVQAYLDTGLINGEEYCYFIRSAGSYGSEGLINPIINFSQKLCEIAIDTTPPCSPSLTIENDCVEFAGEIWTAENFQNRLSWIIDPECADDTETFNVFYAPSRVDDYILLETTSSNSFIHQINNSLAGCYYVTAIDSNENESRNADTICIENCAFYALPNVFTPNGDGINDFFTPFPGWRFVEKIEMKIFNRWGNLVKETENPAINWDGTDQVSGKPLNNGVYLYTGFYFVRRLNGDLERIPLPPNDSGGGTIQLIR